MNKQRIKLSNLINRLSVHYFSQDLNHLEDYLLSSTISQLMIAQSNLNKYCKLKEEKEMKEDGSFPNPLQ